MDKTEKTQQLIYMAKLIKIKKGLDIPLQGKPAGDVVTDSISRRFAVTPDDFPGYTWKLTVKAGDEVEKGSPLLVAKEDPDFFLTSPVNGHVDEVKRGERRHIEYVSVVCDSMDMEPAPCDSKDKDLLLTLKKTGLLALIRQRPYDIVAQATIRPRDIFITAFDSSPLAPEMLTPAVKKYLESGIKALSTLTDGKVYLSVRPGSGITSSHAEVYEIEGPHPAGNVGVQINHIKPVNKGETVWTLDATTAARIGRLVEDKKIDYSTEVAVCGPSVQNPYLVRTLIGASVEPLLSGHIEKGREHQRVISGNVLTGYRVDAKDGFIRFPYRQITVISEGDNADEFMGWASMNPKKFSVKHTFPAFLRGLSKPYDFDARIKGGHRAMILSGEYDKVFPMDILPEYLVKAVLAKDIDRMEKLGIYEVAPEDFALPEFVDTSKLELQKIIRDGLDYLRKETE